jgi:phosphoribosylglycinamide formyltransferase-1
VQKRVVVLVSGTGTNLAALLEACADPGYGVCVVAVGADRPCEALERAAALGVATFLDAPADHPDRDAWNDALAARLDALAPDLIVLAGFMRLLRADLVTRWPTVNTHPALCPAFPGMHAVADALTYGVKVTGATLFLVDAGVDTGPVVAQVAVPVHDGDDVQALHHRIKSAEHDLLVTTVGRMLRTGYRTEGRRVILGDSDPREAHA